MKTFHNVKLSVFCNKDEDQEEIKKTLISLFPFDLEKEKIVLKESSATGFNENDITILEVFLDKQRHVKEFVDSMLNRLTEKTI